MNKTEYRKHCEKQIEKCIKLNDTKHLKEHELSLALLSECECRKKKEENLIKYLEDKNKEDDIKANGMSPSSERDELITRARVYRELLERLL